MTAQGSSPTARAWRRDLARYVVIGVLSIGVDLGLLVLLHQGFQVNLGVATTIAFVTSLLFNFFVNRYWLAGSGRQDLGRHAVRFAILVAVNYGITFVVVTSAGNFHVPYVVAKLAVVAASTSWNFLLYRHWIFPEAPAGAVITPGGVS